MFLKTFIPIQGKKITFNLYLVTKLAINIVFEFLIGLLAC